MLETDVFGPRSLTSLTHLKLWRRVKRWRTGKTAIPCGNDEWRWEQMKLRWRECWRRKMYLILCFRSEGVNEALAPDSQRVIWGGLTLINPKLSPDSALQCVLQGSFRGGLFLSLILSTHTHTHTHTEWNSFKSAETLHYLWRNIGNVRFNFSNRLWLELWDFQLNHVKFIWWVCLDSFNSKIPIYIHKYLKH